MTLNDLLANALSAINNAEQRARKEVIIKPASNLIISVLTVLKAEKYIKDFKFVKDKRGGTIRVELEGNINKVNVIKPHFSVTHSNIEKFEKRYLPARGFGRLIISTSKGVITHIEAEDKKIGGVLLAYVY